MSSLPQKHLVGQGVSGVQGDYKPSAQDELSDHDTVRVKMAGYRGKVGPIVRISRSTGLLIDSVLVYRVDLPGLGVLPFLRSDLEKVQVEV